MRTIVSQLQLVIAATCAVVVGCEGKIRPPKPLPADGPPAGGPTGQPGPGAPGRAPAAPSGGNDGDARLIGELSSRELLDVCQSSHANVQRALAAQVQIDCIAASLGTSGTGCELAREKCEKENMLTADGDDQASCEAEAPTLAQDCARVSVTALRACQEAWIRKLEGARKQLDCGSSIEEVRDVSDSATPSECQDLDARCGAP